MKETGALLTAELGFAMAANSGHRIIRRPISDEGVPCAVKTQADSRLPNSTVWISRRRSNQGGVVGMNVRESRQ